MNVSTCDCGADTFIADTKQTESGAVYRIRKCKLCDANRKTYEISKEQHRKFKRYEKLLKDIISMSIEVEL